MRGRGRGRGRVIPLAELMGDPRIDEIWRALEEAGILSGQRAGERSATVAAAAASEVVGNNGNQGNDTMDGDRKSVV